MAYNIKAILYVDDRAQDDYGQPVGEPTAWRSVWCEVTRAGGSRKTYAGRLAREHSVVLTTHWREGIESCAFVEVAGKRYPIESIVPEGRMRKVHITYVDDGIGYGK